MHTHICEHTHPTLTPIWHSDISLVELANETVKEDDRAVLLEGGGLQSASPKARSSPVTSHVVRFLLMDETFLLENRLTLRAISEFGVLLIYFYLCDCTILFGESNKGYNRDLFLFFYFLLIIVSAITSFKIHHDKSPISGKSILYLNRHQTEEWKGWMQSSDPADNDAGKDKGTGQLAIKCKEGVNKGTRESKPTFLVRNDVGKVLLNALLYPSIKTNMQKNSIVAIFHTAGDVGNNNIDSDGVVACTFLIRTKTEEDQNKLAAAIQEYAPPA